MSLGMAWGFLVECGFDSLCQKTVAIEDEQCSYR